ncbi:MAG: hypothetical protein BGO70_04350 [Bacteroidetes bacterium 43-93]|jgi:signal transduction histidine kinase|nr:response regulator [Bacteroidota bacterium]OJX00001.1 MAG: hypothetical protein BGO70_04350 [Bacteroidetes bacterium 43-93]
MFRQKRILLFLNLSAGIVCLLFCITLFIVGVYLPALILGAGSICFFINSLIAYKEETGIAAGIAIVISDLLLMLFDTGIINERQNTYMYYVPILLLTYVVTRYDERGKRLLMLLFTVACLLAINCTDLTPKLLANFHMPGLEGVFKVANSIIAVLQSIAVIRIVTKVNHNMEEQLVAAKDVAERSSQERMHFLSIMSHELRTPANAVVGLSHLMLEKEIPETIRRDVSLLHYSAQTLKSIVDNILYFNQLEDKEIVIEKKPLDIRKFCRNALDSFVLEAAKKEIDLHFDFDDRIPQYLLGDYDKLLLVINNLLNNAIKFTKKGSIHFWVKVSHMDDNACYVMFKLADTGVGIEAARLKEIFNVFSQINSKITRSYDGMGLGLAISSKLVTMMGGAIRVDSEEGQGSNFYFELKMDKTNEIKDEEQKFVETHDLAGIKILLVEDNKLNVLVAKKILNAMHAEVDVAADGLEGLKVFASKKYDVVLMDLHMPHMDGFETSRRIRMDDSKTPIIAFSADAFEDARNKAKESGMNDFISKPFDPEVLYSKIRQYVLRS